MTSSAAFCAAATAAAALGWVLLRRRRAGPCKVWLVGAGPGAADLISVRGQRLIARADVVVHDRLISAELLALARPGARLINVGKAPTRKRFPQSEINKILLSFRSSGLTVVRVKGGDPFVFGLGGDEVLALSAAGVEHEVVPGISSCTSVPALCGIPVTHKNVSTSFTVLSGHRAPGAEGAADFERLPQTLSTLVVLMGVGNLRAICACLVESGHPANRPAAVIESGTTAEERVTRGTLADIADLAERAEIRPPAIVVVGDVCAVLPRRGGGDRVCDAGSVWGVAATSAVAAPPLR